jgi:hypothetical protein
MTIGVIAGGQFISESGEEKKEEKHGERETPKEKVGKVRNEPAHIRTPAKPPLR